MSTIEDRDELYMLQNLARPLGFWVGVHKNFDPTIPARGGGKSGPYYLMRRKEYPEQRQRSLVIYATAEMIEDFLRMDAGNYTGEG